MFNDILAILIPLVAVAIVFAWVPLLNRISPPCERPLGRRTFRDDELKARSSMGATRD
jgi:hypothetical protein